MKNNQFKAIVTKKIKDECSTFDFVSVAVDESNNSRMIYIYTLDWQCVGIFSLYLTNDYVHVVFTTDLEKPMIVAHDMEVSCKYTRFNTVIVLIQGAFEKLDEMVG